MRTRYRPGSWNVLLTDRVLVMLPPDAADSLVQASWDALAGIHDLGALVDLLVAEAGSFTGLPHFAAVFTSGRDVRVAVRGPVTARVVTDAATSCFTGAEVTTWSERFLRTVTEVELTAAEGAPEGLALLGGVVRADAVRMSFGPEGRPAPVVAPAAAVMSEADPVMSQADPVLPEAPPEPAPATPAIGNTLFPEDVSSTPEVDEFDLLWGETVGRVPEREPVPAGDHDGATISAAEARALRTGGKAPAPAVAEPAADPTAPLPLTGAGRLRVSSGQTVDLDRTVIIGRKPRSPRAGGASLPHLVVVESPQQDISRSHLEVRPEADTVVVIDLHTTNGSTLLRPGAEPVRLHPGEQTLVLSGDTVDIGDGITITFEDLP